MLRQLVATCDLSPLGPRDRLLLLFGFAGALRRSELVALQVEDVAAVAGGLRLRIPRSKTDRVGQGAEVGLPHRVRTIRVIRSPGGCITYPLGAV